MQPDGTVSGDGHTRVTLPGVVCLPNEGSLLLTLACQSATRQTRLPTTDPDILISLHTHGTRLAVCLIRGCGTSTVRFCCFSSSSTDNLAKPTMISRLSSEHSLIRPACPSTPNGPNLHSTLLLDLSITRIFSWSREEILTRLVSFSGINTLWRRLNARHPASFVHRGCQSGSPRE